MIDEDYLFAKALEVAKTSLCHKRQVGAVLIDVTTHEIISTGCNYNPLGLCEDQEGKTLDSTVHAEISALNNANLSAHKHMLMFITHKPCDNCQAAMKKASIPYSYRSLSPKQTTTCS